MTDSFLWRQELLNNMVDRCEAVVDMKVDPELGDVHERRSALGSIVTGLDDQTLAIELGVDDHGVAFATIASYDPEGNLLEPSILEWDNSVMITSRVDPQNKKE